MPRDLKFDPLTHDLVIADGAFVQTDNASTAVLHQLLCHFDRWWGDADLGSRFHDLDFAAADPAPLVEAEGMRCLGALEAAGRISEVQVVAVESRTALGRVEVRTQFRDTQTNRDASVVAPVFLGG